MLKHHHQRTTSRPPRLCAVCTKRPATKITGLGGRIYEVCAACVAPVEGVSDDHRERRELKERIVTAVRFNPGCSIHRVAEVLGCYLPQGSSNAAYQEVRRAVLALEKNGEIERDGAGGWVLARARRAA